MKKDICEIIDFQINGDDRGSLIVLENLKNIPFEMKRIFYMYGVTNDKTRGNHANKDSKFLMIALSGSLNILIDDGQNKENYFLNSPSKGLYVPNGTWKIMKDFSENCVLMVISDNFYNKEEYINEYGQFLTYKRKNK